MKTMAWMKNHITQDTIEKTRALTEIAKELGATTAQLAIAWLLRRKEVSSVITGATRLEQLDENLEAAAYTEQLNGELLDSIDLIFPLESNSQA